MVGLSLTVPDCSRPQYEKYYIVSFVMSIVWISLITSYMVSVEARRRETTPSKEAFSIEGSHKNSLTSSTQEHGFGILYEWYSLHFPWLPFLLPHTCRKATTQHETKPDPACVRMAISNRGDDVYVSAHLP